MLSIGCLKLPRLAMFQTIRKFLVRAGGVAAASVIGLRMSTQRRKQSRQLVPSPVAIQG